MTTATIDTSSDPTFDHARPSAIRQWKSLSRMMTKQMLRDPMTVFFSVVFPLLLAGFMIGLMQFTWVRGPYEVALVGNSTQATALAGALGDDSKVTAISDADAAGTGTVLRPDAATKTLHLVTDPDKPSVVAAVRQSLDGTPWAGWNVSAVDRTGVAPFDPMSLVIPGALAFALLSLALTGTAAALVTMRESGSLRLLATTPSRRPAVLLSLLPGRGLLALVALIILGVGITMTQAVSATSMARVMITSVLGLAMLLSVGYLIGGRMKSPELTNAIAGILSPLLLMATGLLFPLSLLPDWLGTPLSWTPLALFGDALRHDIVGQPPVHSIWLDWGVLIATAVVCTALAARTFTWDTEGKR
ncbi:ABC transporter permease [Yimella sp. cx-573]|nr:ABC transporter permease [Yimella sp. cx-573]